MRRLRARRFSSVAAALVLLAADARAVECGLAPAFSAGANQAIAVQGDAAGLAFADTLDIDLDGAPNAYHLRGAEAGALDTLCNAGRALPGDGRAPYYGSARGRCGEFLADVAAAAAQGWTGTTRIAWFGIATSDAQGHVPFVQMEGEFAGFFVSTTSLQDRRFARGDPRRYLDGRLVPYLVLPRIGGFQAAGAQLGDLAVGYNPRTGAVATALVGDLGPAAALGEGSIAFAQRLRGQNSGPPPATREAVRQLPIGRPVLTLVLPGTALTAPFTVAAIDAAARRRLDAWGGLDRLKACAAAMIPDPR